MKYSIIKTSLGIKAGFPPLSHATSDNGRVMVVNENELRRVDADINVAAAKLGGQVLTHHEVINTLNNYNE